MFESEIAVSAVRVDNACVVRVTGDIDLASTQVIEPVIRRAGRRTARVLVIDLSAVTFFGAAGVTLLVTAGHRARLTGTTLRLVATQRLVLRPMEIMGVIRDFRIHDSVGAALLARPARTGQSTQNEPVPETADVTMAAVVIASPRDPQPAGGQLRMIAASPFTGIAEAYQGCVATTLRAARFGWFTDTEAALLIEGLRALSVELAHRG